MSANPDESRIERPARPRADGLLMHPRALWSFAQIVLYSNFKYNYVVNFLSVQPDFPKPVRIGGKGQPRYIAGDVMAWFESHRDD